MKKIRNMQRPRLATILAGLALFLVLGGSATAASGLINGKKIKKGTVTAKQIKNKTITKGKLSKKTVKSLKGATGPKGDTGAQGAPGQPGPTGPAGADGKDGVVTADSETEIGPENVVANVDKSLANIIVPSGKYVVNADFNYTSASNALVLCAIKNDNSIVALTRFSGTVPVNSVALNGYVKDPATNLSLVCNSTAAGTASNIHLVVLPVAS